MLVASVASGMGMIVLGYGGDVGFDGTFVDALDSLLLWAMVSLLPLGLITVFAFVPLVTILDRHGHREFLAYAGAGVAAGTIPAILVIGMVNLGDMLMLFILPGAAAGLTWWWLVIERRAPDVSDF